MLHGKLLRIHLSEGDRFEGKPLYQAIVEKCREHQIAGATVLRGVEGYGQAGEIHHAHLLTSDRPVIILVVDTPEAIARLAPVIEGMLDRGLFAVSDVEMVRAGKGLV